MWNTANSTVVDFMRFPDARYSYQPLKNAKFHKNTGLRICIACHAAGKTRDHREQYHMENRLPPYDSGCLCHPINQTWVCSYYSPRKTAEHHRYIHWFFATPIEKEEHYDSA